MKPSRPAPARTQVMRIDLEGLALRGPAAAITAAEQQNDANAINGTNALLRIQVINRHPVVVEQQQLLYGLQDNQVLLAQK